MNFRFTERYRRTCFRYLLSIVIFITLSPKVVAQGEVNIWYFGDFMGYNFNATNPPGLLFDGKHIQIEGMSTISNSKGELLFYTTGVDVWDSRHQRMPHGFGLMGSKTSSQSALIVPKPGNPDIYYIFTTDAGYYEDAEVEGFRYTTVNLCENNGFGDVIPKTKNKLLIKPTAEKQCAVFHKNGTDVWIVTHELNSSKFYAYLITENGVNENPVISDIGPVYFSTFYEKSQSVLGQMTFSADGKRLGLVNWSGESESINLYDFNNETGEISNPKITGLMYPYGIEFSPDGTKLYVTSFEQEILVQYDLSAGSWRDVELSRKLIYKSVDHGRAMDGLQLGPDGKLYSNFLLVINKPNEPGELCQLDSISFGDHTFWEGHPQAGLNDVNDSYFDPNPYILDYKNCDAGRFDFKIVHEDSVESVVWNFGDPGSGVRNTSTEKMPLHYYGTEGTYTVRASMRLKSGRTLIKNRKVVWKDFNVNLGPDSAFCDVPGKLLDATQNDYACYLWQDGSTSSVNFASQTGWYWVDVRYSGCTKRDSVYLSFLSTPNIIVPDTAVLCQGDMITVDAQATGALNMWNDGSREPIRVFRNPGLYWVETYRGECITRDSILVELQIRPMIGLPTDTTMCEGDVVTINLSEPGTLYAWSDGDTAGQKTISQPGEYWVVAILNGCFARDTINVTALAYPAQIVTDTLICSDTEIILDVGRAGSYYTWSTGSSDHFIQVGTQGKYTVQVKNHCYEVIETFDVKEEDCDCDLFVPNVFTPGNGDDKNDSFHPIIHQHISYLRLRVFDRWGAEIFSTGSLNGAWDGSTQNGEASSGVYYWFLEYNCNFENKEFWKSKKGYVQLIR